MFRFFTLLLCLGLAAVPVQAVEVSDGWMRALPPGQPTAAAYLTLTNPDAAAVRLVAARSEAAERVEIHRSSQVEGMWRMREIEGLDIPAGGTVILAPGGTHLMLMGLTRPLREGETLSIVLEFDGGKTLPASVVVKPLGMTHHHH
jgi:copper(I)-binding protein